MGFRRQLLLGYSTSFAITLAAGSLAVVALRATASNEARLVRQYGDELLQVERLRFQAERIVATARGYVMTRDSDYLSRLAVASSELDARLRELRAMPLPADSATDVQAIEHSARAYAEAARSTANEDTPEIANGFERMLQPERASLQRHLDTLARRERGSFEAALARSRDDASRAGVVVGIAVGLGLALSALLAAAVMRRLGRQHRDQERATDVAKRAAAGRAEMLAIVSHDLRGPLSTIMVSTDVMSMNIAMARSGADSARHLALIRIAAERMERLVDRVLDAAQIDDGALRLELEECDVDNLLRVVVDLFAAPASRNDVTLYAEPIDPRITVSADKDRVLEVLENLVGNALKFTPSGGAIAVRARRDATTVELSVADTGAGVPPDRVARLFDRYWQGDGARRQSGVGLGLYICKKLVEAHGGRIWVEGNAGGGACFRFTLPLAGARLVAHEPMLLRSPTP